MIRKVLTYSSAGRCATFFRRFLTYEVLQLISFLFLHDEGFISYFQITIVKLQLWNKNLFEILGEDLESKLVLKKKFLLGNFPSL